MIHNQKPSPLDAPAIVAGLDYQIPSLTGPRPCCGSAHGGPEHGAECALPHDAPRPPGVSDWWATRNETERAYWLEQAVLFQVLCPACGTEHVQGAGWLEREACGECGHEVEVTELPATPADAYRVYRARKIADYETARAAVRERRQREGAPQRRPTFIFERIGDGADALQATIGELPESMQRELALERLRECRAWIEQIESGRRK